MEPEMCVGIDEAVKQSSIGGSLTRIEDSLNSELSVQGRIIDDLTEKINRLDHKNVPPEGSPIEDDAVVPTLVDLLWQKVDAVRTFNKQLEELLNRLEQEI